MISHDTLQDYLVGNYRDNEAIYRRGRDGRGSRAVCAVPPRQLSNPNPGFQLWNSVHFCVTYTTVDSDKVLIFIHEPLFFTMVYYCSVEQYSIFNTARSSNPDYTEPCFNPIIEPSLLSIHTSLLSLLQ
jgi:hypothetical protein